MKSALLFLFATGLMVGCSNGPMILPTHDPDFILSQPVSLPNPPEANLQGLLQVRKTSDSTLYPSGAFFQEGVTPVNNVTRTLLIPHQDLVLFEAICEGLQASGAQVRRLRQPSSPSLPSKPELQLDILSIEYHSQATDIGEEESSESESTGTTVPFGGKYSGLRAIVRWSLIQSNQTKVSGTDTAVIHHETKEDLFQLAGIQIATSIAGQISAEVSR